jgi:biotin carboxylase
MAEEGRRMEPAEPPPEAVAARRLAFVYHPASVGVLDVAHAAADVCELVWVIDRSMQDVELMAKLLARLGELVDVTGLAPREAASVIADARPDGILALEDERLLWTSQVAEQLALPAISPTVAHRLTDKLHQREALRAGGLAVPDFWPIPPRENGVAWSEFARNVRLPAMIKPRRSAGSRNVLRVETLDQLNACLDALPAAVAAEGLLLEGYIPDRREDLGADFAGYVSVESIVANGHISHLAVTGRLPPAPPFRESGYFIPAALSGEEQRAVLETATAAVGALGVTIGTLHCEIKLTPQGPRVIELNGRMGGEPIPEMLTDVTGIEALTIPLRLALGETIIFEELPACSHVDYGIYVQAPIEMHRLSAIEGLDELGAQPGVNRVIINRGPGRELDWREGNWGHVYSVHGSSEDHAGLRRLLAWMATRVRIVGE